MESLQDIERDIRRIEEKLVGVDAKRQKVYWLIPIGVLGPLLLPFIPRRGSTLADKMGYVNAMLLFAVILAVVLPIAWYLHIRSVDNETLYLEDELSALKKKKAKLTV